MFINLLGLQLDKSTYRNDNNDAQYFAQIGQMRLTHAFKSGLSSNTETQC